MDRSSSKNGSCQGVKKIRGSKPEGIRRIGRHGLRWLEDGENDLREMTVKRWRQQAWAEKNGRP